MRAISFREIENHISSAEGPGYALACIGEISFNSAKWQDARTAVICRPSRWTSGLSFRFNSKGADFNVVAADTIGAVSKLDSHQLSSAQINFQSGVEVNLRTK